MIRRVYISAKLLFHTICVYLFISAIFDARFPTISRERNCDGSSSVASPREAYAGANILPSLFVSAFHTTPGRFSSRISTFRSHGVRLVGARKVIHSKTIDASTSSYIRNQARVDARYPLVTRASLASELDRAISAISSGRQALSQWKSRLDELVAEPVRSIRTASMSMYLLNAALAHSALRREGRGLLSQAAGITASLFATHHLRAALLLRLNALDASESVTGTTPSVDATIAALSSRSKAMASLARRAILEEAKKQWVPRSSHPELFERCFAIMLREFVEDERIEDDGSVIIPKLKLLLQRYYDLVSDSGSLELSNSVNSITVNSLLSCLSRTISDALPVDDAGALIIDPKDPKQVRVRARLLLFAHLALRAMPGVTAEHILSLHRILDARSCKGAIGAYLSDHFNTAAAELVSLQLSSEINDAKVSDFRNIVEYIRHIPEEMSNFGASNMSAKMMGLVQEAIDKTVSDCNMGFVKLEDFDISNIARLVSFCANVFNWDEEYKISVLEDRIAPLYTKFCAGIVSQLYNMSRVDGTNLSSLTSDLSSVRDKLMLSYPRSKRCFRSAQESFNRPAETAMNRCFDDSNRHISDKVIELFLDQGRILHRIETVYCAAWNVTTPKLLFPKYDLPASAQIDLYKKAILPLVKRDSLNANHKGAIQADSSSFRLHEILRRLARIDPSVMELHDRELLLPKMLSQITTAFRTDTLSKWNSSFYEQLLVDYSIPLDEWRQNISLDLYRNELERFSPPLVNFGIDESSEEDMVGGQKDGEGEEESNLFSHMNEEERQQLQESKVKHKHKTKKDCWPKLPAVPRIPTDEELGRLKKFSAYLQCDSDLLCELHTCIFGEAIVQMVSSLNQNMSYAETMAVIDRVKSLRNRLSISPDMFESLIGLAVLRKLESGVFNMTQLWRAETGQKYDTASEDVIRLVSQDSFVNHAVRTIDTASTIYRLFGLNITYTTTTDTTTTTVTSDNTTMSKVQVERTDELGEIYKLFAYHRMVEDRFGLKKKLSDTEALLSKVLGFNEEETVQLRAELAGRLVSDLLTSCITTALQSNESWFIDKTLLKELKTDLAWIQSNIGVNTSVFKESFVNASREVTSNTLEMLSEPSPTSAKGGAGYSQMDARAQRLLRLLISELKLDFERDVGLPRDLLDDLFVLELQGLIDNNRIYELNDMAISYGIDNATAKEACSGLAEKYLHEVAHFALLSARDNDDDGCRKYCVIIARYIDFVRHPIYVDASMFKKDDVDRLVMNFEVYLDSTSTPTDTKSHLIAQLRDHIALSAHAKAPMSGAEIAAEETAEKSDWNWG